MEACTERTLKTVAQAIADKKHASRLYAGYGCLYYRGYNRECQA